MKMWIVLEKRPRIRFIGHLDMLRTMQRALRRSGLPVRYSNGFNPHMLLNFAAPLSLGMPGRREVVEVALAEDVSEREFTERLTQSLPPELRCVRCRAVDDLHPAPMALLRAAGYHFELTEGEDAAGFVRFLPEYWALPEIPAIRKTKTGEKPCDLKPLIHVLQADGAYAFDAVLALCEAGTCKPDLLLTSMAERLGISKPEALVTRTQLFAERDGKLIPLEEA
ncbi:MAG: DUF2344 domain-containing protein [Clostridia bacterium]|nr:DUF2344 domain-containing protein [Clostridia bacterium]